MKRFYKTVSVETDGDAFLVTLDGRTPRTPSGSLLALPSRGLADRVAQEWDAQSEAVRPQTMPLTRLANVAIDRTPDSRSALADELVRYCTTDLVCHLADAPRELVARQDAAWAPVREWAASALRIALKPTVGIIAVDQEDAALKAARDHALSLDDFRATGLAWAVPLFGSALLGLAVERGELRADDAFERSRLDEAWQIEQWGEDDEAAEAAERRRSDAAAIGRWFDAL